MSSVHEFTAVEWYAPPYGQQDWFLRGLGGATLEDYADMDETIAAIRAREDSDD